MNKRWLFLPLMALVCLVSGCASLFPDPLSKAEATPVPGVTAPLHSPMADESNTGQQTVALYFRFNQEPMLAGEARELTISPDEPSEKAVVQALLDGPGTGNPELTRLFPARVQVLNTVSQGSVLYVTFNDALLNLYSDEPADWQDREEWRGEVPLRRRLARAGLTASILENFPYQSVQVLVQQLGDASASLRLENSYFHSPDLKSGLAEPFRRDEDLILTPHNTVLTVLSAWEQKDWDRLYLYISASDPAGGAARPGTEEAYAAWDQAPSMAAYAVSGGSVCQNGSRAVVNADITLSLGEGREGAFPQCPVTLFRDRGVWKMSYGQLMALMGLMPSKEEP